jgi:DNA-binding NarL/FixJ family response regulator
MAVALKEASLTPCRGNPRRYPEAMTAITPPSNRLPVVVAEDERLLLSVLPALLRQASSGRIDVIHCCASRADLLQTLRRSQPAVVVCDIRMPNRAGDTPTAVDARYLRTLFRHRPDTRLILLTGHTDPLLAKALIDAGAHGHLEKSTDPAEMCRVIIDVSEGRRFIAPPVRAAIERLEGRADRTVREQLLDGRRGDVLRLLLDGQAPAEIAASLCVGRKYVDKRIAEIKRITGVDTHIRIYRVCERLGIIDERRQHRLE